MHTSLAGTAGHDLYAPCAVHELHEWGFDYWALGHIHVRSEYAGASTVVMPGMPQGRDIGEAGPKTVSLVTVGDDRSIVIEETGDERGAIRADLDRPVGGCVLGRGCR